MERTSLYERAMQWAVTAYASLERDDYAGRKHVVRLLRFAARRREAVRPLRLRRLALLIEGGRDDAALTCERLVSLV